MNSPIFPSLDDIYCMLSFFPRSFSHLFYLYLLLILRKMHGRAMLTYKIEAKNAPNIPVPHVPHKRSIHHL